MFYEEVLKVIEMLRKIMFEKCFLGLSKGIDNWGENIKVY